MGKRHLDLSPGGGGGFVDGISLGASLSSRAGGGAPRRRGRLAVSDAVDGGPVTVTAIDRDGPPTMTGSGRYRIG
jgi:hypothetical protein